MRKLFLSLLIAFMAVPVIASVSTAATATAASSLQFNAPSGVSVGDLLVLCGNVVGGTMGTTPGWTFFGKTYDGAASETYIAYRVADGTGTDTPSFSIVAGTADLIGYIIRVTGSTTPFSEFSSAPTSSGSSTSPAVPSGTTLYVNDLLIAAAGLHSSSFTADPSTWTQKADGTGGGASLRIWSKSAVTAGSCGGETATISPSAAWGGVLFGAVSQPSLKVTDNMGFSEVQLFKPNYTTFTHESLAGTDTPTRHADAFRQLSENMGLKDSPFAHILGFWLIYQLDNMGFTDTPTREADANRQLAENMAGTDTMTFRQANANRQLFETLFLLDTPTREADANRQLAETLYLLDTPTRHADANRQLSETVYLQDTPLREADANRQLSETIYLSDSFQTITNYFRQLAETVFLQDTPTRSTNSFRTASETMGVRDVPTRSLNAFRAILDALGLTEGTITRSASLYRALSDNVAFTDSVTRSANIFRQLADNLAGKDSQTLAFVFWRAFVENMGATDLPTRQATYARAFLDALGSTDTPARSTTANRQLADNIGSRDLATRSTNAFRSILDSLGIKETIGTNGIRNILLVDGVVSADARLVVLAALLRLFAIPVDAREVVIPVPVPGDD